MKRVGCFVTSKMRQRVWHMLHQPAKMHQLACVRVRVCPIIDYCALSALSTTPCQQRGQPLATRLITRIKRPAGRATP